MPPSSVHFNGSVNLPDAETVMREISSRIPAGVRLQLQYPTPLASMAGTIVPEDLPAVAPAYEQALFADLDTLLERLPHDRIAVQWDIAVEMGALEGAMGVTMPMEQIAPGMVRCLERVPADVPAGLHLCYAYFEPLGGLGTGSETELNFAVVPYHPADQAPGTTDRQIERIDAALGASAAGAREWGICTECGMGRVDAPDVPGLLDLHSRILTASR